MSAGPKLAQEQKDKLARCLKKCEITSAMCKAIKDFDDKANQLLITALEILKETEEHQLTTLRNIMGYNQ